MANNMEMKIIGRIHTDFPTKFGIPRQSGVVAALKGRIVFEPEYRNVDALRGIDGFSHLWLVWLFSGAVRDDWSPTVRPPILGGNKRVGVFATRSPFRPNPIGLSSVKLERVELDTPEGPVLVVSGADLMDGTPIFDIKPYIPYADSHPEATEGFRSGGWNRMLEVDFPPELFTHARDDRDKRHVREDTREDQNVLDKARGEVLPQRGKILKRAGENGLIVVVLTQNHESVEDREKRADDYQKPRNPNFFVEVFQHTAFDADFLRTIGLVVGKVFGELHDAFASFTRALYSGQVSSSSAWRPSASRCPWLNTRI